MEIKNNPDFGFQHNKFAMPMLVLIVAGLAACMSVNGLEKSIF